MIRPHFAAVPESADEWPCVTLTENPGVLHRNFPRKIFYISDLRSEFAAIALFSKCERYDWLRPAQKFTGCFQKSLDYDNVFSYLPLSPKSHVPMGVRRPSNLVRKSVRYLELTPPVASPANRTMRGHLKQRRCGPFCSLPAFHQPGLLKRHTFIARSAVGTPFQSKADKAEQSSWQGVVHLSAHRAHVWIRGFHRLVPAHVRACPLSSGFCRSVWNMGN